MTTQILTEELIQDYLAQFQAMALILNCNADYKKENDVNRIFTLYDDMNKPLLELRISVNRGSNDELYGDVNINGAGDYFLVGHFAVTHLPEFMKGELKVDCLFFNSEDEAQNEGLNFIEVIQQAAAFNKGLKFSGAN